MTAPHIVDPAGALDQALGQASPDLMRSLLQTMVNALLSADADGACSMVCVSPSVGRTDTDDCY